MALVMMWAAGQDQTVFAQSVATAQEQTETQTSSQMTVLAALRAAEEEEIEAQ